MKKVIVIGAGNWGKNLVRNFYDLGALSGVVEVDHRLRAGIRETYPDVGVYENLDEALASDAEAVAIATPAPTHYELARRALEKGKDVFVEKPMALSSREARDLAEYAELHGRILMVGHLLLYQPAVSWLRDYLARGEAGQVWHVATRRAKLGKVRTHEDVWWSFAPHDVSVVLELLGRPKVRKVKAHGHAMVQKNVFDDTNVLLDFEDGQTAHIHSSWYWPENVRSTTILCEKKMLVYDEVKQAVTVYDKGINQDLSNRDDGSFVADITNDEPLKLECQHFLDCLETRRRPRSDAWNGLAVVEILERAQAVMRSS